MNFKIDTKEKFKVITPFAGVNAAIMTAELEAFLISNMQHPPPHVVLNLKEINNLTVQDAGKIAEIQQQYYAHGHSFVICEMNEQVKSVFNNLPLDEPLNMTPTESEAWDMIQMEEIERDLMDGFDEQENQ